MLAVKYCRTRYGHEEVFVNDIRFSVSSGHTVTRMEP